jgi:zinc/manganese transport system substrate-binding protein
MKRISFFAALAVALLPHIAHAKLRVVTTTQDPAAITRAIGGDRVSVTPLAKGYQDPHFLDAKPSYMLELNRADLVEAIGLELEIGYLPSLLAGARNPKVLPGQPGFLDLSTAITPLEVKPTADRSQGDIHPSGNPHYWLDPENGRKMAAAIAERLTALDASGKDVFTANLAAFNTELDARMLVWKDRMAPLKGKPIVTFHASWPYFARAFGVEVVAFVEPKPGIPPSANHTVEVIKRMQADNVKILLIENFYDARVPKLIASKVSGSVVQVPNSVAGEDKVKTYFDLFDRITNALAEAAGKS